jgi:putative heme-binding domain-containing protein
MPPSGFSSDQAGAIVAYLRSVAASAARGGTTDTAVRGDTGRGQALFEGKGECARCHRVNGVGPRLAPDLSDIGAVRTAAELQQKLVDPNALIRAGNRFVELTTKEGKSISGRLLNYDSFSIQLLDSDERLVSMPKSMLRDYKFLKTSTMPSFRDKLSGDEMTDLVGYLVSLKGPRP